jgi:hypothetical protein
MWWLANDRPSDWLSLLAEMSTVGRTVLFDSRRSNVCYRFLSLDSSHSGIGQFLPFGAQLRNGAQTW